MSFNKKISETAVRIGPVRFGYVKVHTPRMNEDGTPGKYQAQLLIPKSDKEAVKLMDAAFEAAKKNGVPTKWKGKMPASLKNKTSVLRDGDDEKPEDDTYAGMWFVNASSPTKPGVRVLENGAIVEALDDDDFYSGCWGCASVNLYPYEVSGNMGVAVALNNVIKTKDGDRLSGGASADADFADLADSGSYLD